jgi:Tfp pilus assembly protein PilV
MKYYKKMLKIIRKSHFQLLEVMIAAFILLVCAIPTLRIFTNMYLSQQNIARENQRDHLAHLIHAKIIEQMYMHTISLDRVLEDHTFPLDDPSLQKKLEALQYNATYTFTVLKTRKSRKLNKPVGYFVQLIITIKDLSSIKNRTFLKQTSENQNPLDASYDYSMYIELKQG